MPIEPITRVRAKNLKWAYSEHMEQNGPRRAWDI